MKVARLSLYCLKISPAYKTVSTSADAFPINFPYDAIILFCSDVPSLKFGFFAIVLKLVNTYHGSYAHLVCLIHHGKT